MKRITGLLLALILLVGILPGQVRAIHEYPADAAVVYDGNAMAPFQNRTREEIGQKYAAALNANPAYGDRPTWYDRMPSLSAPYDQGKLSQAAADEMNAMTNYYRWLVGTQAMTGLSGNHDDLQKGALIRNWDFGHDVDVSKKPDDMDLSLWNEGANVAHNIIVMGAKPRNAIEAWLAEGYNASSAQWGTIGHRWCLLANAHSGMDFGYCGSVGIGRFLQNDTMTWGSNAFAAYPAPGWMPSSQINSKQSAWTVELNSGKLTYDKVADLTVTVTDLSGGSSYTCTSGNGKLRVDPYIYDRGTICFVQPAASGTCYAPGSSYRVVMTGLKDAATGKAASITYVVNFFDVTSYTPSAVKTVTAPGGWTQVTVANTENNADRLAQIAAILPQEMKLTNEAGYSALVQIASPWVLDRANACWKTSVDPADLPPQFLDPNGALQEITIPYVSWSYTGHLTIQPTNPKVDTPVVFRLWRYVSNTTKADVYQVVPAGETWKGIKRFDRSSDNFFLESDSNGDTWCWNHTLSSGDGGTWIGIYYFDDPYYSSAYVAAVQDVSLPVCSHLNTHTERQEPTCTASGKSVTICDDCGQIVSTQILPALGHLWDEGVVTIQPTLTEPGEKLYTCSRCGETKKETVNATGNPFVDVKKGDFFYYAVLWAFNHDPQITAGTNKTHFSPYKTCTREQVVTFLWRAKGCEEPKNTQNPFKDVPADAYYTEAVLWAVEKGITNGKSKTKFGVGDPCTRGQVVTFLWRAEGEPEPTSAANPFKDVSETDYFYKAVLWAVENGITKGTSKTKFSPTNTCTRGQVVTFLYRDVVGEQ